MATRSLRPTLATARGSVQLAFSLIGLRRRPSTSWSFFQSGTETAVRFLLKRKFSSVMKKLDGLGAVLHMIMMK